MRTVRAPVTRRRRASLLTASEVANFKKGATISAPWAGARPKLASRRRWPPRACRRLARRRQLMAAEIAMEHHLECDPIGGSCKPCIDITPGRCRITAAQLALRSNWLTRNSLTLLSSPCGARARHERSFKETG
jgi:hypothetical protein